jgi:hypothetical protein
MNQQSNSNKSNSSNNSNNKGPSKKNYRPKHKSNNTAQASGNSNSGTKNDGPKKPNNNKNRKRYNSNNSNNSNNNNNRNGNSKTNRVCSHYDTLQDQHIIARKKFFELFYRADKNQKRKLENKFNATLEALRKYEAELKPDQKILLQKKVNGQPLDLTYSSTREMSAEHSFVEECTTPDDIHINEIQKERDNYSTDTEESLGSIDDYKKYKGIVD